MVEIFERDVESQIKTDLFEKGHVTLLYGPRRVGKTFLCKKILTDFSSDDGYRDCEQFEVVIKDTLPVILEYVPGSTVLQNSNNPEGKKLTTDALIVGGINIGDYLALEDVSGHSARVYFKAKILAAAECGKVYENWGIVKAAGFAVEDSAKVVVDCN
jgi:AAA+ ATPase superfamily predicted ATPase